MNKLRIQELGDVSETLLIPLYFRASESQRDDAIVSDPKAVELLDQIDFDPAIVQHLASERIPTLIRLRIFDQRVRAFLEQYPDGIVVDIGCGLDTRFHRLDNGRASWFDLDLPAVIELRRKLLAEEPRNIFIGCSALDFAWMDLVAIRGVRPTLFVAEGVFPYLTPTEVKQLVLAIKQRFPGSQLLFDAMSPLLRFLHNRQLAMSNVQARLRWALRSPEEVENWSFGIQLLSESFYFDQPEMRQGWHKWLQWIPALAQAARIVQYRLGVPRTVAEPAGQSLHATNRP